MRFSFQRLAGVLAITAFCTCSNLDHVDFDASGKATIPKATLVETLLGGALDFTGFDDIDFSEQFQNQGVSKDQVDGVHIKTFTLSIDAPTDGNFDFLDGVVVTASSDGLPTIQVASLDHVPKGAQEIELDVDASAELQPYVVAPSMTLGAKVQGHRPDEDTSVSAAVVLDVDVHIPGCE